MLEKKEKLNLLIKNAEELHGHLGPFLVIGVRIGEVVKEMLKVKNNGKLQVTARIPLKTPFSCILDGIQASTQCTVGNGKLQIINSQKAITVWIKLEDSESMLEIRVNSQVVEELKRNLSQGASNQELAWKVMALPENRLFTIEKQ